MALSESRHIILPQDRSLVLSSRLGGKRSKLGGPC